MRHRILLVDDDPGMVTVMADYVRFAHPGVIVATGGRDALAWLERQRFAVVVTDLVMGDIDGLGLLREALRLGP